MTNLKQNTPKTLNEAIQILVSGLTAKEIKYIKQFPEESVHFSSGMTLRNSWGLWKKDSPLVKDITKNYGISHGDDCSSLLMTAVWSTVKGKDVKSALKKQAELCKNHWLKMGVDPITGKEIKGHFRNNDKYITD